MCAFFCERRHLEPWNYGNNSAAACLSNESDIGRSAAAAANCRHDMDDSSPVFPTVIMACRWQFNRFFEPKNIPNKAPKPKVSRGE